MTSWGWFKQKKKNDDDNEEDEVELKVKELTLEKMASFSKITYSLSQVAMDIDPSLERSQHFTRALQSSLAPYKELYAQKQNAAKQTTITKFFTAKSKIPTPPPPTDM